MHTFTHMHVYAYIQTDMHMKIMIRITFAILSSVITRCNWIRSSAAIKTSISLICHMEYLWLTLDKMNFHTRGPIYVIGCWPRCATLKETKMITEPYYVEWMAIFIVKSSTSICFIRQTSDQALYQTIRHNYINCYGGAWTSFDFFRPCKPIAYRFKHRHSQAVNAICLCLPNCRMYFVSFLITIIYLT